MLSKIQITAATVALSFASISSSVSAMEVSLEEVVSSVVTRAVTVTAHEISLGVYTSIANANHHFSLDDVDVKTQVLISNVDNQQKSTSTNAE